AQPTSRRTAGCEARPARFERATGCLEGDLASLRCFAAGRIWLLMTAFDRTSGWPALPLAAPALFQTAFQRRLRLRRVRQVIRHRFGEIFWLDVPKLAKRRLARLEVCPVVELALLSNINRPSPMCRFPILRRCEADVCPEEVVRGDELPDVEVRPA